MFFGSEPHPLLKMRLVRSLRKQSRRHFRSLIPCLEKSLAHASLIVGPQNAANFVFRFGPCDVCGGACLCRPDEELVSRLLTGLKPVGTFIYCTEEEILLQRGEMDRKGLTCWSGINRCGMFEIVASLRLDVQVADLGTPWETAFRQVFIVKAASFRVRDLLYRYRSS